MFATLALVVSLSTTLVVSLSNHEPAPRPSTGSGRAEASTGAGRAEAEPVVSLDVIVDDARGRAIETLKTADFDVREDGASQPLDAARFVRDGGRLFAIYLDEYGVAGGEPTERVRRALAAFIDGLAPDDLLVVMKPLDSLFKIELTRDRAAARSLVAAFEGRKDDYAPRTDYERELIAGSPARVEPARAQVVRSGIEALVLHLGSAAAGRKTLIVASQSLGTRERRRGGEPLPTIDTTIRAAARGNVAVYALDPSDPPAGAAPDAALHRLITDTNGRVVSGDLEAGLKQLDADARGYYLLTYRSSHPADGRFHDVDVRVKRSGATVRARRGFFDATPEDAMRASVLAKLNQPKPTTPPEPPPHASPLIRPWFGWARGADGRTRVTFVWEPAAQVPGDRNKKIAARLVFTALAPDGSVLFEGPVAPTGAGTIDEPGAVSSRAVFDASPGRIKLRMSIQDAAAQVIDRDVRDIAVRDVKGIVALGTPEVMRARNARELRTLGEGSAVPVVARDFSRAEELLVRVPVYGDRDAAPSVSARLLNRGGQPMRDLAVSPASDGVDEFRLPLAGLALGDYMIEVRATGRGGEARDRIDFQVR